MASAAKPVISLAEQLRADHLPDADLREEIESADPGAKPLGLDPDDPKGREEYSFNLNWKDGRGKAWTGAFASKILTIAERQMVGALQARFSNVPVDRMTPFANHINGMVAHLTFSLKERPEWAKDLRSLHNVDLIQAIYDEVASHEAVFFGLQSGT